MVRFSGRCDGGVGPNTGVMGYLSVCLVIRTARSCVKTQRTRMLVPRTYQHLNEMLVRNTHN